ncbi:MAG: hypothetical protein Q7R97_00365 [Candidatus Daviesbacteria bacterium]|nr:hypothetical protein [Candidatus Daviesbacteria bacterium]
MDGLQDVFEKCRISNNMEGLPKNCRSDEGVELANHLSGEVLTNPKSWDILVNWLTERADSLPLLGWDRNFVKTIGRMDSEDRKGYFQDLQTGLLSTEECRNWKQLTSEYKEVANKMISFWRILHDL